MAVAGIAKPAVASSPCCASAGLQLEQTMPLPDHHDFARIRPRPQDCELICTRKDAVKLWRLAARRPGPCRSSWKSSRNSGLRWIACSTQSYHRPMDPKLLELLVCPVTKGHLDYDRQRQELLSRSARLAYPIRDGIPILLEEEARTLSDEELERLPARTPLV